MPRLCSFLWLCLVAGLGCSSAPPAPPPPDDPPVADAGQDQVVQPGQSVTLDGSGSADPEGAALTYSWNAAQTNPQPVALATHQARVTFTPVTPGIYTFILIVNDGQQDSAPDSVRVTVVATDNQPPVAVPVSTYSIYPFGAPVVLDAINSTDPDGDSLTYRWRLLPGQDSTAVTVADSTARQTEATISTPGEYRFELVVSDGELSDRAEFTVRVEPPENRPPQPVISAPAQAAVNTAVTLDASGTTDPDGDPVTLSWMIVDPAGLHVPLTDSAAVQISFTPHTAGVYVILLEAKDGKAGPVRARAEVQVQQQVYTEKDGMIQVPAGPFVMGSDSGAADEAPPHQVTLSTYWIDKYEVTAAAYAACVAAGNCTPAAAGPQCNGGDPERGEHPINCVTWQQANDYCAWAGKRLPTEAEWEKAARGTDGRRFPWGNAPPGRDLLNYNDDIGGTVAVGTYPLGVSFYGLYNMGGNVHEWTADFYSGTYYSVSPPNDPPGPATGLERVARGASWRIGVPVEALTATARNRFAPETSDAAVGFRCARTPSPGQ